MALERSRHRIRWLLSGCFTSCALEGGAFLIRDSLPKCDAQPWQKDGKDRKEDMQMYVPSSASSSYMVNRKYNVWYISSSATLPFYLFHLFVKKLHLRVHDWWSNPRGAIVSCSKSVPEPLHHVGNDSSPKESILYVIRAPIQIGSFLSLI